MNFTFQGPLNILTINIDHPFKCTSKTSLRGL